MLEPLIDPGRWWRLMRRFLLRSAGMVTLIESKPDHCPAMGEVGQLSKRAKVSEECGRFLLGAQGQDGFK